MQTITIGTTPLILLNPNKNRVRWSFQFVPSSIISGNTGKIYLGRGFIPNATDGDPNQGESLIAGAAIEEKKQFKEDVLPYKGPIWIVASAASQIAVLEEQSEE